jgi:hypothetical protein
MHGYADTTSDTSGVTPDVPRTLRRAGALVAMAREAAPGAPTVRAAREASAAYQDAAAVYDSALANYNAGYYSIAPSNWRACQ